MRQEGKRGRRPIAWSAAGLVALAVLATAAYGLWPGRGGGRADAGNPKQVALGQQVYAEACASCHGENLEGQPNWRIRLSNGRLPAPPHDAKGHTWHHPDEMLFGMTKDGIASFARLEDYETDMPAYAETLSDREIWAVIAYIKSRWPAQIQARQEEINARYRAN